MTKEQAIKLLSKDTSISEIHKLRDNGLSHTEVTDKIQEAMDMGIEAIEKQIAKKIEEHNKTCKCRVFDYMDYECTQRVPYCCVCGQRIDWSEADD